MQIRFCCAARFSKCQRFLWLLAMGWAWILSDASVQAGLFTNDFAALESCFTAAEQPFRQELCLNGLWQFQPVALPGGYQRERGLPPELPAPGGVWDAVPIKIPSPWNVNAWGCGRNVGVGTPHPFWPDSVCFPSYPASWDGVEMGWLRKRFSLPGDWKGKRILLHFGAVAGQCQIRVNGKSAGEHFENFLPFELDVTALVKLGAENELLVGVRHPHLFDKSNPTYPHERRTYANGSCLDGIVGIWQDVCLHAVPDLRVTDAFVQSWVSRGELEIQATLQNDSGRDQELSLSGGVCPWINEAPADVLGAPEPKWKLGDAALILPAQKFTVPAASSRMVTLKALVGERLKTWSPATPCLYGLVLTLSQGGRVADVKYQRFGWRQFQIQNGDLLLNGRKLQIAADILHPFGVPVLSRRHAWAWFKAIKDVGGNGVRLHAQPWPAYYQDMADEMGLVVLAEDGLFGSSLALNFTEPVSWQRFAEHYDAMVVRDRNHPSVFGWSFGNELFAIFDYNHMASADRDKFYAKLTELGRRSFALDPTRQWISCDGDEDLRGTLPVWSKHLGHGLHLQALPAPGIKPLMIGESGGTYYARPSQMAEFNGERAYESYAGRNEALAIDVYQNVTQMARPKLAYFSASELVWFGLEHLALGYSDFTRLPGPQDGVRCTAFQEGRHGIQPERIPPYVTTLNPGLDPSLPLYKPLAMFDAMKAALAPEGPQPSPWDHAPPVRKAAVPSNSTAFSSVGFLGNRAGRLYFSLDHLGVPLASGLESASAGCLIIDGETLNTEMAAQAKSQVTALLERGGQVVVCFHQANADVGPVNRLLPAPVALTRRTATALARAGEHPWNQAFTLANLYFAENPRDKQVLKCGIAGEFVRQGTAVLKASDTDWSLFNNVSENAKCAAVVLYEHWIKPPGEALVTQKCGRGSISVCTIEYACEEAAYRHLWRTLLTSMGIKLGEPHDGWLVPVASVRPVNWRFITNSPADGWQEKGFDERGWKVAKAGFGTDVPNNETQTPWTTSDIWLRNTFDARPNPSGLLKLVVHHDEDAEVYINGQLVWSERGFISNYKEVALPGALASSLKPTGNQIAVHCHQTVGGQYIDVGLAEGPVWAESAPKSEHDLLLNGPQE